MEIMLLLYAIPCFGITIASGYLFLILTKSIIESWKYDKGALLDLPTICAALLFYTVLIVVIIGSIYFGTSLVLQFFTPPPI